MVSFPMPAVPCLEILSEKCVAMVMVALPFYSIIIAGMRTIFSMNQISAKIPLKLLITCTSV